MKKLYTLFSICVLMVLLALCGWLISCQEKEEFIPLKIFSVEPAEALIGDTVVINGEGFSPGITYNRVFFSSMENAVTPLENSTPNRLFVAIPEGARSGAVTVNLFNEESAESPALTVVTPVVERVEPTEGLTGDTVIIRGLNFRPEPEKNIVRFNPTASGSTAAVGKVISGSTTELKVIVPLDSRTGKMSVLSVEGPEFSVLAPAIKAIEPLQGIAGDTITIVGRGFVTGIATTVSFAPGTRGTLLESSTSRALKVVVPEDANDGVVTLEYGAVKLESEQSFLVYPGITGISPRNGISGMTVTINGSSFGATAADNIVRFGALQAKITSASAQQIKATVPPGAETGAVTVETNGRTATGPDFEISTDGTPLIFALEPGSGPVGSIMSIEGDYFSTIPSENIVHFSSDSVAVVQAATKTQLTVKVPYGAMSGPVTVTRQGKTGTGPDFKLTSRALPVITLVAPDSVNRGADFTLNGGNFATFTNDIRIRIGDFAFFKPLTATESALTGKVPANASAGEYSISIQQYGAASNSRTITIAGQPQITAISVAEGSANTSVTLTGIDFHNIEHKNTVKFGNEVAKFVDASDNVRNQIKVYVPDISPGTYNITVEAFGVVSNVISFRIKTKPGGVKNIFYTRRGSAIPGIRLEKATFDPPSAEIVYQSSSTATPLASVVVDLNRSKVYFAYGTGVIARSNNLDNTAREELVPTGANTINDLTLDVAGNKLYWSAVNGTTYQIIGGSVSGGAADVNPQPIYTGTGLITGITYSPEDGKLYFIKRVTGTSGALHVMRMDPANAGSAEILFSSETTPPAGVTRIDFAPVDIKIDREHNKIFFLCGTSATLTTTRRNILISNLDGTGVSTFHNSGTINMNGIALDAEGQYVYWIVPTAGDNGFVYRKRYDGAVIEGTDPPVAIQQIYTVNNQTTGSAIQLSYGLAIEESTGRGSSQRGRNTSQRGFSMSLPLKFTEYQK